MSAERSGSRTRERATRNDEIRLMQEINRNLNRMEDRIQALETIVTRPSRREPAYR